MRGLLEIEGEKGKAMRCGRHRGLCAFGASSLPECCLSAGRDRLRPVRGVRGVFTGLLNIRQAGLFW